MEGAPVLVVEVVSPTDRASDIVERIDDYLDAGARLIWVVYPSGQQVVEYNSPGESRILRPGDRLDGGDVLPGFSCPVDAIFADLFVRSTCVTNDELATMPAERRRLPFLLRI